MTDRHRKFFDADQQNCKEIRFRNTSISLFSILGMSGNMSMNSMTRFDSLSNALDAYLDRRNTPYAVMVSGYWGVGKTHYIFNSLIPGHDECDFHYLSLFGLKSTAEVRKQIDQKLNLNPDQSAFKQVVCLDDLERWHGDLDYCLSYVNDLVEHRHCKCILIGNLEELSEENLASFTKAQEKTIRHVYRFNPSMAEILDIALTLVDYGSTASRQFIRSLIRANTESLYRLLTSVSMHNIRLLGEAIQFFEIIYRHHSGVLRASKALAFNYFQSLVSMIVLVKRSFLEASETRNLLEGGHESNKGFKFLSEVGYFDQELSMGLTGESRILLDTIFYRLDRISLQGICSIVRNGFYVKDDFRHEFDKWVDEADYERYLDREYFYELDNDSALAIFNKAVDYFVSRREVTNPVTLLLLAERVVEDIANGAVDYDPILFKKQVIETVDKLYESGDMEITEVKVIDLAGERFRNCSGIYNYIIKRNNQRLRQVARNEIVSFWSKLAANPSSLETLMARFSPLAVLSEPADPAEKLAGMESLDNIQLNRFVNWIMDDIDKTGLPSNGVSVKTLGALSRLLVKSYGQSVGIREFHFRRLAQILNTSTVVDQAV